MKVLGLTFAVLALAFALSADAQAPSARITAMHMTKLSDNHLTVSGKVQITIGTTLITAESADIQHGAPGTPSDITLTGTVRVRAVLNK